MPSSAVIKTSKVVAYIIDKYHYLEPALISIELGLGLSDIADAIIIDAKNGGRRKTIEKVLKNAGSWTGIALGSWLGNRTGKAFGDYIGTMYQSIGPKEGIYIFGFFGTVIGTILFDEIFKTTGLKLAKIINSKSSKSLASPTGKKKLSLAAQAWPKIDDTVVIYIQRGSKRQLVDIAGSENEIFETFYFDLGSMDGDFFKWLGSIKSHISLIVCFENDCPDKAAYADTLSQIFYIETIRFITEAVYFCTAMLVTAEPEILPTQTILILKVNDTSIVVYELYHYEVDNFYYICETRKVSYSSDMDSEGLQTTILKDTTPSMVLAYQQELTPICNSLMEKLRFGFGDSLIIVENWSRAEVLLEMGKHQEEFQVDGYTVIEKIQPQFQ